MTKMKKILNLPDKGSSEPGLSVLAKFYRNIMDQANIDLERFHALMTAWLNNPENGIPKDVKTRSFVRGNLTKALSEPDMTWKTFIKGLLLMEPITIELRVRVTVQNKTGREKLTTLESNLIIPCKDIDLKSLEEDELDDFK